MSQKQFLCIETCNQSDIEQLGVCTVRLRHNDNNAKCRFFVVLGDGPALLGVPDIEMLNILKTTCEMIGDPHESRKFNLQTIEVPNGTSCRANKSLQIKTVKMDANELMLTCEIIQVQHQQSSREKNK